MKIVCLLFILSQWQGVAESEEGKLNDANGVLTKIVELVIMLQSYVN